MVKKTLLSLAVATALASMAGCNVSTTDKYDGKIINEGVKEAGGSSVYPLFNPAPVDGTAPQVPLATDIIFAINNAPDGTPGKDGTAATVDNTPPVTTAVNKLAGFSTVAPLYINFSKELEAASVIAGKTVLLVKIATGDKPLEPAENPNPIPVDSKAYETSYVELEDANGNKIPTVRILPTQPLEPKSKYLVVFTDGIKGVNGEKAGSSAMYAILESADKINGVDDKDLTNPTASLRKTIQGWQQLSRIVLNATGNSGKPVFSYTFTTDGSSDDLKQYAAPALFVKNNLSLDEAEELVKTLKGDATLSALKGMPGYPAPLFAAIAQENLGGTTLTAAAKAPKAQNVTPSSISIPSQTLTTSSSAITTHTQGIIELPDFLGLPIKTADMAVATGEQLPPELLVPATLMADPNWSANTAVGGLLAAVGKPGFPPKDSVEKPDGSKDESGTNVTYHYPFPQPTAVGTISVPYLLTLPGNYTAENGVNCTEAKPYKTVIFVHGITSNRVASAAYGAQLASQCIATVAIDLPLHGIAPADGTKNAFSISDKLAPLGLNAPWQGIGDERHGYITQDDNMLRMDMSYTNVLQGFGLLSSDPAGAQAKFEAAEEDGNSGSAFINLQNFGRTHDNLRQAVTDLLNLNASLENISSDLDVENVYVAGHSLGGIVASAFVAVNNDPEVQAFVGKRATNPAGTLNPIKGLIIANSGGHITKLLENSPGFAPTILGGLKKAINEDNPRGIRQGSENLEKFLYVFQSLIDGIDPANTTSALGDIPVQLFTVVGDAGTQTPPDTTVPVFDYFGGSTGIDNPFAQAVIPACYEDPEATGCANPSVIALPSADAPTAKAPLAGTQAIVKTNTKNAKFAQSTYGVANHSTFADAGSSMPLSTPPTAAEIDAAQKAQANFGDMVAKSVKLINGGGATAGAK